MIIGILFITFISWPKNTGISYFTENSSGDYEYFKKVVSWNGVGKTAGKLKWNFNSGDVWVALFTFLYG